MTLKSLINKLKPTGNSQQKLSSSLASSAPSLSLNQSSNHTITIGTAQINHSPNNLRLPAGRGLAGQVLVHGGGASGGNMSNGGGGVSGAYAQGQPGSYGGGGGAGGVAWTVGTSSFVGHHTDPNNIAFAYFNQVIDKVFEEKSHQLREEIKHIYNCKTFEEIHEAIMNTFSSSGLEFFEGMDDNEIINYLKLVN